MNERHVSVNKNSSRLHHHNGKLKDINVAAYFSLALNESTDVSNLSQFIVIARYVAGDTLNEESFAALPKKGTTRGEDLFKSFIEFDKEKYLLMNKVISECTDGAPCGGEKQRICSAALLRKHENRLIVSFHFILYQEPFCVQL